MIKDTNITGWFTTDEGVHVPIHGTETKAQALDRAFGSHYASNNNEKQKMFMQNRDTSINNIIENHNKPLNNRESVINYVKHMTNIDLNNLIESNAGHPRSYLGVHLEKLSPSDQRQVREVLNNRNHNLKIEDNGGLGHVIYYEKNKK